MNQAFNSLFDLNKNTKISHICNFAFHSGAGRIILDNSLPWIRFKLLDSEREPFVFTIDL